MNDEEFIDRFMAALHWILGDRDWQLRDLDGAGGEDGDVWVKLDIYTKGMKRLIDFAEDHGL